MICSLSVSFYLICMCFFLHFFDQFWDELCTICILINDFKAFSGCLLNDFLVYFLVLYALCVICCKYSDKYGYICKSNVSFKTHTHKILLSCFMFETDDVRLLLVTRVALQSCK